MNLSFILLISAAVFVVGLTYIVHKLHDPVKVKRSFPELKVIKSHSIFDNEYHFGNLEYDTEYNVDWDGPNTAKIHSIDNKNISFIDESRPDGEQIISVTHNEIPDFIVDKAD